MTQIIVIIAAIAIIGFIAWWFFGQHTAATSTATTAAGQQTATVSVNGGYNPSTIVLKQGVPATITFNRKDQSHCLEQVVFDDLGISEFLPENEDVAIAIDTTVAGEHDFACGMNMFHGKVVVR